MLYFNFLNSYNSSRTLITNIQKDDKVKTAVAVKKVQLLLTPIKAQTAKMRLWCASGQSLLKNFMS